MNKPLSTSVTNQKDSSINNVINDMLLNLPCSIFEIVYSKDLNAKTDWFEHVSYHVIGERKYFECLYTIQVATYSQKGNAFTRNDYVFHEVIGTDIVSHCFENVKEIYDCNMLGIYIKKTSSNYAFYDNNDYECCYLFARN